MNNFDFKNPTKIIFGKNTIEKLSEEIPKGATVLMLYGGGSIKKNGVYNKVIDALTDYVVYEMGGIPPNPEYDVLIKALDIIKAKKVTYLLAVGGGSVIDGTKFISAAALYKGDPWEVVTNKKPNLNCMPFGTVLTLPATGSEMNSGAVITRKEFKEKMGIGGAGLFPQFSILDPKVIKTIPQKQIANGLADAFTHVLEQYVTYPIDALLQDRFSESVMQTLVEIAPKIMADQSDYKAASNFMWSCTMALNGLIQKGVPTDWVTHIIGHELTALYGIDHARTLAIITKSQYTYRFESKKEKLAQLAKRVFNVQGENIDELGKAGIDKIESFYQSLGIDTKLSDYIDDYEGTAEIIADRFTKRGMLALGENGDVTPNDVTEIVKMSY